MSIYESTYRIITPAGVFEALFGDDDEPVRYQGDESAILFFTNWIKDNLVTGEDGHLIDSTSLTPTQLYGFCQPPGSGITVIPPLDDMISFAEQEAMSEDDDYPRKLESLKKRLSPEDNETYGKSFDTAQHLQQEESNNMQDTMTMDSVTLDGVSGIEKMKLIKELGGIRSALQSIKSGIEKLNLVKRIKEIRGLLGIDNQAQPEQTEQVATYTGTLEDGRIVGVKFSSPDRVERLAVMGSVFNSTNQGLSVQVRHLDGSGSVIVPVSRIVDDQLEPEIASLFAVSDNDSYENKDPLASARDRLNSDEFKRITKDFIGSLGTIKGLDEGTIRGYSRSLFVNSITGNLNRLSTKDPELVAMLLAWIHTVQSEWNKPAIANKNVIWGLVDRWEEYLPLFAKQEDGMPSGNDATPDPEANTEPETKQQSEQKQDQLTPVQATENNDMPDPIKSSFIAELEALKSETDINIFNAKLDEIAGRIEQAGLMEALDKELNDTADVLTRLLAEAEKES